MDGPLCLLLLPAKLEDFILRETAQDLLRAPRVVALEPPRVPLGLFARVPPQTASRLARRQARRLHKTLTDVKVIVMFHPLQLFLAEALRERHPGAEIWYSRWDRYEAANDASPKLQARLEVLHKRAAERADWVLAINDALVEMERSEGRTANLVVPAHDSFPAAPPAGPVAVSLGHLGYRTDWALLRGLAERMPDLVLLLIGARHDEEMRDDEDFAQCLKLPNLVWLGRMDDEPAARIVACADVGIVPFRREPFNDAALPQRIVKYARLGRRSLSPELEGVRTWDRAVTTCATIEDWERELRGATGERMQPDLELRDWALAQTAEHQNQPLWDRLEELGVVEFAYSS